jgi:uncharacterized delta-60 repeat protein
MGSSVAAFRPDGSPDLSFFSPVFNGRVQCLAVQRNGGILAGGNFQNAGGLARKHLVRLLPDGALDASFDAGLQEPLRALAVLPDDKILAGGDRPLGGEPPVRTLVRLMPDGTPDPAFQCSLTYTVTGIGVQADGRALVCGVFPDTSPVHLFNTDGSDAPFPLQISRPLRAAARRPDGVLTAAIWDDGIMRFDTAGLPAPGYLLTLRSGIVGNLALQADGACVAAGEVFGGDLIQRSVGRVRADGGDDTAFFARTDQPARSIALQEDGRPVLAGLFQRVNNDDVLLPGLVRLHSGPAVSSLSRDGSTALRWMRGGTAPEVSDVSFEINTPGGNGDAWTLLGSGTRIAGGWELTGLNLPDTCRIRARARAGGSLTQAEASYPSPLEAWRLRHFGAVAGTGDAADGADPDKDGLTNLVEFAFDLDPANGGGPLPAFILTPDGFTAAFTAPEGREAEVGYRAVWSSSLAEDTWNPVPDTGVPPGHVFRVPATGVRVFIKWEVSLRTAQQSP